MKDEEEQLCELAEKNKRPNNDIMRMRTVFFPVYAVILIQLGYGDMYYVWRVLTFLHEVSVSV